MKRNISKSNASIIDKKAFLDFEMKTITKGLDSQTEENTRNTSMKIILTTAKAKSIIHHCQKLKEKLHQ